MANNVAITAGSGTSIATDDVSNVHYQVVKLALGDEDVATRVSSASPLPVDVGTLSLSGEDHIGQVGGTTTLITPAITISTSTYSAGDVIGGEITLTNAMRISSGSGVWHSLAIFDADNEKAAMDVLLFDANPAGTYTDNNAPTWNTGDFDNFLGRVNVAATDYLTVNARAVATKSNIGITVRAAGSQNLYAICIVTGTPAYAATTNLTMRFGFLCD